MQMLSKEVKLQSEHYNLQSKESKKEAQLNCFFCFWEKQKGNGLGKIDNSSTNYRTFQKIKKEPESKKTN